MNLRIENVRHCLSTISTWLTFDEDTRFIKDERNKIATEYGIALMKQLESYTIRSRKLFNVFSESLEDIAICRMNLRCAIEREKEMKRNRKEEKI